jgi:hypothetical protein
MAQHFFIIIILIALHFELLPTAVRRPSPCWCGGCRFSLGLMEMETLLYRLEVWYRAVRFTTGTVEASCLRAFVYVTAADIAAARFL